MIRLHDYWRSGAGYRVRIALALKGIAYERVVHDLRVGAHRAADYAALNPQRRVPAVETPAGVLTQSLAIIEWLEEVQPAPPLLPRDPAARAIVRGMAQIIACDVHPLGNLAVLAALRDRFDADEAQVKDWIAAWIGAGFAALEPLVARHGGTFAFGDTPGLADCCLVPQLYSAERFGVPLDAYPQIVAAGTAARALPAFAAAHPSAQADADPA